jgi:hypothetical protein
MQEWISRARSTIPPIFRGEIVKTNLTMREILTGHVQPKTRATDTKKISEYPHLEFIDVEHYRKALKLANELGEEALDSFKRSFETLERLAENETAQVHPDCTPNSFYFRIYRSTHCVLDGGIILHGMGQSFSVEFPSKRGIHWSVHT